jgi:maltose alpha-D-glucosyltransferase/alpha-amylase
MQLLRRHAAAFPEPVRPELESLLTREAELVERVRGVASRAIRTDRIRIHGDYHLGQVLYTGKDFVIIDFEGEPARPLGERRLKRSCLRDAAGMLRSFQYAAYSGLVQQAQRGVIGGDPESLRAAEPCARAWYTLVGGAFLRAYLGALGGSALLPAEGRDTALLLEVFMLDKALYEIGYELNSRPSWAWIPLRGLAQLLENAA